MAAKKRSVGKVSRPNSGRSGPPYAVVILVRLVLVALAAGFLVWKIKETRKKPSPVSAPVPPTSLEGPSGSYLSQNFSFTFDGIKTKRGFSGWGDSPRLNQDVMGETALRIKGVNYKNGIGSQAASEIVFDLGGRVKRFSCLAGVDEKGGDSASVIFAVKADNKKVFQSPLMRRDNEPVTIDVDVTDAKELSLIMDPAGDPDWDHGDWINLKFEKSRR